MGSDDEVAVKVEAVVMSTQGPVVLLAPAAEVDPELLLPIFIDPSQAFNIQMVLKGHIPPRPMTHDLFSTVVHELGGTIERVVIEDLANNTFFASMYVKLDRNGHSDRKRFDARPSDGIALAVRAGAQLYVRRKVIEAAAIKRSDVETSVVKVEETDEEDVDLGVEP